MTAGRGGTVLRRRLVVLVAVLLDGVFSDAANDGSTDCSEETVVDLVAGETTGGTTGEGTGKTTLAILGITGGTLLLLVATVICQYMVNQVKCGGNTYPWRFWSCWP